MLERDLYVKLRKVLHRPPYELCAKTQDAVFSGLPDVYHAIKRENGYPDGLQNWIELKYVPKWPVRDTTSVKVDLSVPQRRWLETYSEAGVRCWVVLGVDKEWFLWRAPDVPDTIRPYDEMPGLIAMGPISDLSVVRNIIMNPAR